MKRAHVVAAAVTTALTAGVVLAVAAQPSIWETWRPATCMPDRCFCEAIRSQLVRQPANSASGAAFAGVAMLVLFAGVFPSAASAQSQRNHLTSHPVYSLLYAAACLLIGLGTAFYHASLTFWGQTADVLGMYLIATFLVLFNLSRLRHITPGGMAALYGGVNALLLAGLILLPEARRFVFAALILSAIALEFAARRKESASHPARLFGFAAGTLALGFFIWILDITRTLCSPYGWVQGHALWHLSDAAALWLVYRHYESAAPVPR